MKNTNIPPFLLCSTTELARQVLEKIERESDLRFEHDFKKDEITSSGFYPELVIRTVALEGCGNPLDYSQVKFYEKKGITNFTKAEDFLLSDETKIRLEELDNKLDKLINDMTNKTWRTLSECDSIIDDEGDVYRVVGVCGQMVFMLDVNQEIAYDHKDNLINSGYKIKGASEDKPSIDEVISLLKSIDCGGENNLLFLAINKAVEMLKKIKHGDYPLTTGK